jgi:hypothetical protein
LPSSPACLEKQPKLGKKRAFHIVFFPEFLQHSRNALFRPLFGDN